MIAIKGVYDGHVVRPMEPLNVAADTDVVLVVLDTTRAKGAAGDTSRFFGCLKDSPAFARDGVSLQKEWRSDWRD